MDRFDMMELLERNIKEKQEILDEKERYFKNQVEEKKKLQTRQSFEAYEKALQESCKFENLGVLDHTTILGGYGINNFTPNPSSPTNDHLLELSITLGRTVATIEATDRELRKIERENSSLRETDVVSAIIREADKLEALRKDGYIC